MQKLPQRLRAPPPDPHFITPACYCKSLSSFLALNAYYYPKKEHNCSKCSAFTSSAAFALIFHFKLVFVDGGRKNISCPRAQGTLATPLLKQSWKVMEFSYSIAVATLYYCYVSNKIDGN